MRFINRIRLAAKMVSLATVVCAFTLIQSAQAQQIEQITDPEKAKPAISRLLNEERLQALRPICPADMMAGQTLSRWREPIACADTAEHCTDACLGGSGEHCHGLGLALMHLDRTAADAGQTPSGASGLAFAEACRLGNTAGCSWRILTWQSVEGDLTDLECLDETHRLACDAGDPTSCYFSALYVIFEDFEAARELVRKGCREAPGSDMCREGQRMLKKASQHQN